MSRCKFYFIAIILSLTATVAIAQKPNFLTKSENKMDGACFLMEKPLMAGKNQPIQDGLSVEES